MSTSQHTFVAEQYAPRAQDYVTSINHSTGDDLDQIEAELRGCDTARVLDLGCGGGHVSYRAAPHVAEVVACDVTASMLEVVTKTAAERGLSNITVQQAAAEQLPFEDASFDVVLCRFTAHHWQNMEAGLREARRVLKRPGRAVFIDVIAPSDRVLDTHIQAVEVLRDPSHVRNYTMAEWVAALSRSGFSVERMNARKLRMDFPVWIARTRATLEHAGAIRSLQAGAPVIVRQYFAIAVDGGFDLDTMAIVTRAA
jgi:ubiquinone/menaquinone biosynthesis C-methylase UbiE